MRKYNLNNLYESSVPPTDINLLWADKDENTGELRAIHKYNKSKGEWEPSMVSVDYIKPDEQEGTGATITTLKCNPGIRINHIDAADNLQDKQLIQIVLPNSPYYGEVSGTQTRVHIIAEDIYVGDEEIDYENPPESIPMMDILVLFEGNRNGFPFDPENYRGCKLKIVASEDDLEVDSNTTVWDGGVPSIRFTKYTIKPNT